MVNGFFAIIKSFFMQTTTVRGVVYANRKNLPTQESPALITSLVKASLPLQVPAKNIFTYHPGDGHQYIKLPRGSLGRNVLQFGAGITRDMLHVEKISDFFISIIRITIQGGAGGSVTINEMKSSFYKGSHWLGSIELEQEIFSLQHIRYTINGDKKPLRELLPPAVITPAKEEIAPQPESTPAKKVFVYNAGDGHQRLELQQGSGSRNVLQFGAGITLDMLHFAIDGFIQGSVKITIKDSGSVTISENRNSKYSGCYSLGSIEVGGKSFSMDEIRDAVQAGKQPWPELLPPAVIIPSVEILPEPAPPVVTPVKPVDPHTARVMEMIGAHQYKWEKNGQKERKLTYSFNKYSPLQLADYLKKYYPHVYESEMKDNLDDYRNLVISSAEDSLKAMVRKLLTDLQKKIGLEFEEITDDQGGEADTDLRFLTYDLAPGDNGDYPSGLTCMLTADNKKTSIVMIRQDRVSENLTAHEIGHALGLRHTDGNAKYNYSTVMQPHIYVEGFTDTDIAVLKEKYGPDVTHAQSPSVDKVTSTEMLTNVMSSMPQHQQQDTVMAHHHPDTRIPVPLLTQSQAV